MARTYTICYVLMVLGDAAAKHFEHYRRLSSLMMASQRSGEVAKWRCGEVAKWRSGEVAKWRSGDVAKWRSGEV